MAIDYGISKEIAEDDPRQELWAKQREERGFDNTELWALDQALAKMIIPRLKAFKESHICYPCGITFDDWNDKIQKMIDAFEEILTRDMTKEQRGHEYNVKKIKTGLNLFAKWYHDLWS